MSSILKFSFLFILNFCFLNAKDLGCYGQTFPILEQNLLIIIQKQLDLHKNHGDQIQMNIQESLTKQIKSLREVQNISKAKEQKIFYFDPTTCANQDITNHEAKVIVAKGFCFNPLNSHPLKQAIIFFDATDDQQLQWAIKFYPEAKWILTKGYPLKLEEQLKRPVFFDQQGLMTKKFGIMHVPAYVEQEGLRLKIEEVFLENESCTS